MDDYSLKDLIYHGKEERNLEYKCSMSWKDISTKTKVLKSCLSMANIPYGGVLIFGVDEVENGIFEPNGMAKDDIKSFNQDDVADYINGFVDPYIGLKLDIKEDDGKWFIVIQINEFDDIPVVCKKSGEKGVIN